MKKETIKYKHWKTGEKIEKELSFSHPSENKTDLFCPFDNTPIIRYHDGHGGKGYECPNCGIEYGILSGTQENVDNFAKQYFEQIKNDLENLEKEKKNLETKLNHARNKGIINKANLSSRERDGVDEAISNAMKYATKKYCYVPSHLGKDNNNKANLSSR